MTTPRTRNLARVIADERVAANAEIEFLKVQRKLADDQIRALSEFLSACDEAETHFAGIGPQYSFGLSTRTVRSTVLDLLEQAPDGMSSAEICRRVTQVIPTIGSKTPTMTLTRLKQAGIVDRNDRGLWHLVGGQRQDD